jgi:hypothetical protein
VRFLLERNAADELTDEEAAELEHFMQLVKIRTQEYLKRKHDQSPYPRFLTARGAGERYEYCLLLNHKPPFLTNLITSSPENMVVQFEITRIGSV